MPLVFSWSIRDKSNILEGRWRQPEGSLAQGMERTRRGSWWFGLRSRTRRQESSYGGHMMAMPSALIYHNMKVFNLDYNLRGVHVRIGFVNFKL